MYTNIVPFYRLGKVPIRYFYDESDGKYYSRSYITGDYFEITDIYAYTGDTAHWGP